MVFCKMAPTSLASRFRKSVTSTALRSYVAEFISTFFYVFSVVGASMSSRKFLPGVVATTDPSSLLMAAIANAFALASAVYIAANISGGHLNPAVTFGMAVAGHVSVPTALFYWFAQMLASVMACIVLRATLVGQRVTSYAITEEMTGFGASVVEGVLTFALVYTVFAASDSRRGPCNAIGAVMIGLMAGANVLAAGPFSGGSVNPACAFGSAIVAGSFKNQAVYWVGPLIGAALAGIVHDNVVFPAENVDSFRGVPEAVVV